MKEFPIFISKSL